MGYAILVMVNWRCSLTCSNEVAQDNIILTGAYLTATGLCPWFKNSLKKGMHSNAGLWLLHNSTRMGFKNIFPEILRERR